MRARVTGRFAAFADFELEAFLCGELPVERRRELERAVATDAVLRDYLAERARAQLEFAAAHPLRAAPNPLRSPRRWLLGAGVAAPALVIALWWSAGSSNGALTAGAREREGDPPVRDEIRIKGGGLAVELYVKRGERVFRPRTDEALEAGDRVRLSVEVPRAGYLSLFARDERGAVSVYYDRLPVQAGRFTAPDSLLLDASPSDERWLLVVDSEPRSADHYTRAFAAGQLPDAAHALIDVRKEKP
jgi:hypothetical protein